MVQLCTAFIVGVALLIVSIATVDWAGMALGGGIAAVFGLWIWFKRRGFLA